METLSPQKARAQRGSMETLSPQKVVTMLLYIHLETIISMVTRIKLIIVTGQC